MPQIPFKLLFICEKELTRVHVEKITGISFANKSGKTCKPFNMPHRFDQDAFKEMYYMRNVKNLKITGLARLSSKN